MINDQKELFPLGINVNSRHILDDGVLVRTFERGVQRLTQACGTGSSCTSAWHLKGKEGKVKVTTMGGNMEVTVQRDGIVLRGPATVESFRSFDEPRL
jgi:diaminopimelate epimerase